MRNLMIGVAAAASLLSPLAATSASAQPYGGGRVRHEVRECHRELRHAGNRWQFERERRECEREIARARWEARHDRHDWRRDHDDRHDDRRW